MPSPIWRIGLLLAVGLAVAYLVYVGGRALYRAATTAPDPAAGREAPKVETPAATRETPKAPAAKRKATDAPRTPIALDPLYLD